MKLVKGLVHRQISPKSFVLEGTGTAILSHKMITFDSKAVYPWNSIREYDLIQDDIVLLTF